MTLKKFFDTDIGYATHQIGQLAIFWGTIFIPFGLFAVHFCNDCTETYNNGFYYLEFSSSVSVLCSLVVLFICGDLEFIINKFRIEKPMLENEK